MKRFLLANMVGSLSLLAACSSADEVARPRPPVDVAAPAKTETATFALG
jgi:hypothetical protein